MVCTSAGALGCHLRKQVRVRVRVSLRVRVRVSGIKVKVRVRLRGNVSVRVGFRVRSTEVSVTVRGRVLDSLYHAWPAQAQAREGTTYENRLGSGIVLVLGLG